MIATAMSRATGDVGIDVIAERAAEKTKCQDCRPNCRGQYISETVTRVFSRIIGPGKWDERPRPGGGKMRATSA